MKYLPKILGAIALVAGNVAGAVAAQYPTVAFWAGVAAVNAAGLGVYLSRNHGTSDEEAGAAPSEPKA